MSEDSSIVKRPQKAPPGNESLDEGQHSSEGSRSGWGQSRPLFVRHTLKFSLALFTVGAIGLGTAWFVPSERPLLVTIGTIALFSGFLTYSLDTDRLIRAEVARAIYEATDRNHTALVEAFNLSTERVYVPTSDSVLLYVPADRDVPIPDLSDSSTPQFPGDSTSGLTLVPSGCSLFRIFQENLIGELSEDPQTLAEQIAEGLTDTFEIAWKVQLDLEPESGQLDVTVIKSIYPPSFDTPPASFIAVALASSLQTIVVMEFETEASGSYRIRCHWNPDHVAPDT